MIKTLFNHIFSFTLFGLIVSSCSDSSTAGHRVITVSIEPQKNILEHIVGDKFSITTIMPRSDDPESFEPSPSKIIDIENSLAFFSTGLLPFENKLGKTYSNVNYINTSKGIKLIYGTHTHGTGKNAHFHSVADPHVWTSVRNAKVMAKNMLDEILKIDPENSEFYTQNFNKYLVYLDSIDMSFIDRLGDTDQKSFLVWHPSLSYFAHDYGLEQISVNSEAKELSVMSLADVIEKAKRKDVKVMFFQQELDNRQGEMIANSVNARIVPVNPLDYDWEGQLNTIIDVLASN